MLLYNIIFVLVQLYRRNIFASASSRFNSFALNRTLHPNIMSGSRIFSKWVGSSNNVFQRASYEPPSSSNRTACRVGSVPVFPIFLRKHIATFDFSIEGRGKVRTPCPPLTWIRPCSLHQLKSIGLSLWHSDLNVFITMWYLIL